MGHKISLVASGTKVSVKWIADAMAMQSFTEAVKSPRRVAQRACQCPTNSGTRLQQR